jgi:integrase
MGGAAEGWRLVPRRGIQHVRFTHAGYRYEISTKSRLEREASERAAQIYADVVSGRLRPAVAKSAAHLVDLFPEWLTAIESELDKETVATYGQYAKRWLKFFGSTLGSMSKATCANYKRARLLKVCASTVRKELSALRGFLAWCVEQEVIEEAPVVAGVPKRTMGTRVHEQRPDFTPTLERIESLFRALPPRCRGGHLGRARFIVAYETGLRPATLDVLSVPEHFTKGATHLALVDEDDKGRWGRPLPLSPRARAVLDEVATEGLIFGEHDYRGVWALALKAAGLPETMVQYDLRHARIQHLLDAGAPLTGVAYLAGHKLLTTTNHYARGSAREAERAVTGVTTGVGPLETASAKEGGRTPTRVTSLEPERSGVHHSARIIDGAEPRLAPRSVGLASGTGVGPRSAWVHEATANLLGLLAGVA